jgi:hypothetical protein
VRFPMTSLHASVSLILPATPSVSRVTYIFRQSRRVLVTPYVVFGGGGDVKLSP